MTRNDILKPYRLHLELTGRAKEEKPIEMTVEEIRERIRNLKDSEILTVDFGGAK